MRGEKTWFKRFQQLCSNTYDVPHTDHRALSHIATTCKNFKEVRTFLEEYGSDALSMKIVQLKSKAQTMTHLLYNRKRAAKRPSFLAIPRQRCHTPDYPKTSYNP